MSVMRPYLTCKWILAPFSTVSSSTPVALISRVWPLYESIKLAYNNKSGYMRWVIIADAVDAEATLLLNLASVWLKSSQRNGVEIAYASGGLGDKSTESITRMSVGGFEQKRSGFSPGTSTMSPFTETWFPLNHDDRADTVMVRTTERRSEVSFIVGECYSGRMVRWLRWSVVSGSERWSWKLVVAVVIAIMRLGRNGAAFACCGVQARAKSAAILLVRLCLRSSPFPLLDAVTWHKTPRRP